MPGAQPTLLITNANEQIMNEQIMKTTHLELKAVLEHKKHTAISLRYVTFVVPRVALATHGCVLVLARRLREGIGSLARG